MDHLPNKTNEEKYTMYMIKFGTNSTCWALTKHFDMHQNVMATNLLASLLLTSPLPHYSTQNPLTPLPLYSHAYVLYNNEYAEGGA